MRVMIEKESEKLEKRVRDLETEGRSAKATFNRSLLLKARSERFLIRQTLTFLKDKGYHNISSINELIGK